jgi:thiol-disulfide isomerase/thioredoxin
MKRLLLLSSVLGLLSSAAFAAAVHTKSAEPRRVAQGEEIALADYLVPGKITVFDFTSKFCPPCRGYDEPLKELHAKRDDLAIVQVDINRPDVRGIDWQSPVARQYDLHSIPHFKVYSAAGQLVAEDKLVFDANGNVDRAASSNAARKMVDAWINASAP